MIRYFLLLFLPLIFALHVKAQFWGAPSMEDEAYKANKIVNKQPDLTVVNLQQFSLGNGVQVYKDIDKNIYLSGDYYIQINMNLYALATFNKGLLNGSYEEYRYKNISKRYNYKNGLQEGEQITFYSEGNKRSTTNYKKGVRLSMTNLHENGQLEDTETYDELGQRNGTVISYDNTGKVKNETTYVHGSMQGKSIDYNPDGTTKIAYYKDSKPEGVYQMLYTNGKTKTEGLNNNNSNKTGKWTDFYESGNLKSEIYYTDGIMDGSAILYYENGKIASATEYKQGKKNGKYEEYNESPYLLLVESNYKDDRLDGIYKGYNEGKIWRDCIYTNGKLVYEKQYLNGKISVLRMLDASDRMVDVKKYDTSGKSTYQNKGYKKNSAMQLVEDDYGIIDIE